MFWARDIAFAVIIVVTFTAAVLCCDPAYGYPENVRLGYQTCTSCHVSPGGGGVLTAYGRGFAEELSTVRAENSGALLYDLAPEPPSWLLIGGDTRYLNYRTVRENRSFAMQNDLEVAIKASKEITFDGSIGSYYGSPGYQTRRFYSLWSPSDNVSVRIGHFMPVYGLMVPDHTSAIKAPLGYNEGQESYNTEAAFRNKQAELFLTATAGDGTQVTAQPGEGTLSLQGPAYTARASWFLNSRATLGGSYALKYDAPHVFEQSMGPFAMLALNSHLYLLSEADRHLGQGTHFDVSYTEAGYEAYSGVHLQLTHEYESANIWGIGFQLFPVTHAEVLVRAKYDARSGDLSSQLLLHLFW